MDAVSLPSAALVAANENLLILRTQALTARGKVSRTTPQAVEAPRSSYALQNAQKDLVQYRRRDQVQPWYSDVPETAVSPQPLPYNPQTEQPDVQCPLTAVGNPPPCAWVKLYPDIGLGMLRQEMTAPGRLWLLLRYLDGEGKGSFRIDSVVQTLTPKTSALRLCGKRQLRNLLRAGECLFWTRGKERIWLRSAAWVAHGLGVNRLHGRPVALPLSALLSGIGAFRAHLYTAFHSGRRKETRTGRQTMPIARETLAGLSGVGRSSQRSYESQVGVTVTPNFAVGDLLTKENQEKRAWGQGQALFELRDYFGEQGRPGNCYLAWQLPNSYVGQHQQRPKGRQKRINRQLKDLVTKGTPGNVEGADGPQPSRKRYYPQGKLAVQASSRYPTHEVYWRERGNGRYALWQQVGET